MNCSTTSRSTSHYNTHLYHPYSRNLNSQPFNSHHSSDTKSFNQLGINCSTNQLNTTFPIATSSANYSGLLATVAKPADLYTPNHTLNHANQTKSSNYNHHQANHLSGDQIASDHMNFKASVQSNVHHSNQYSNQLNHLNHLDPVDRSNFNTTALCTNSSSANSLSGQQSNHLESNSASTNDQVASDFANEIRLDSDEIDFVMAYISSNQDEPSQKMYSNQNSSTLTELTNASHLNKENYSQLINNCQVGH